MRLALNERKVLYDSLKNGYIDLKKPLNTIRILAKYYFSIGVKKSEVFKNICNFFEKNNFQYNKLIDIIEKTIEKINRSKDFSLTNIEYIGITEKELKKIKELPYIQYEKLAFAFLVYAKIYNIINKSDNNWVNEEHKYIFSDAKVNLNITEQGEMINKLCELGYFTSTKIVDKFNIKVNYIDDTPNPEYLIKIRDFRNYVYEYLKWKGTKVESCHICGILFLYAINKVYCKSCYKENQRKAKREFARKYYGYNIKT